MRQIRIRAAHIEAIAELNTNQTADAIWQALPIVALAHTWGDEMYFEIPIALPEQDPQSTVALGDLGYWPPGSAFCVFFGPTPVSRGDEIRPASPVNVFGRVLGDVKALRTVRDGAPVTVERASAD